MKFMEQGDDNWLAAAGKLRKGETLCFFFRFGTQPSREEVNNTLGVQWPDKNLSVSHVHGSTVYVRRQSLTQGRATADDVDDETIINGRRIRPLTAIYLGRSEMGRSTEDVECPFCHTVTMTYIWSRCGGGKRCQCGAVLRRITADKKVS